jgi:hypothetical protein
MWLDLGLGTGGTEFEGVEWASKGVEGNRGGESKVTRGRLCVGDSKKSDNALFAHEAVDLSERRGDFGLMIGDTVGFFLAVGICVAHNRGVVFRVIVTVRTCIYWTTRDESRLKTDR